MNDIDEYLFATLYELHYVDEIEDIDEEEVTARKVDRGEADYDALNYYMGSL